MTGRQWHSLLIRETLGVDPDALTEAQYARALDAAYASERGPALAAEAVKTMSADELDEAVIYERFGIEADRLTPPQKARLLGILAAEAKDRWTVPSEEWEELRAWAKANRDRVHALAGSGGLIELPGGRRESPANLLWRIERYDNDDVDAQEIAAEVRTVRKLVEEGVKE